MGAQLNIKSEDAYRMASRLSEITGESLTAVVTRALRTELERAEHERSRTSLKATLSAIADKVSANMAEQASSDHNWLYDDETGLPV
jgi:antitoxin VapB